MVVTASHNHAKDNGVKLVDGEGNVLGERYEGACEARSDNGKGCTMR